MSLSGMASLLIQIKGKGIPEICLFELFVRAQTIKEYKMEKLLQVDDADIPLYRPDVKYKQVVVSVYFTQVMAVRL